MARNPREGYVDPRGIPHFRCCQHCPEYPEDEHNVYGIAGHTLPCTRCSSAPDIPARADDTKGGYPAGNAPVSSIRKPPPSVSRPMCAGCRHANHRAQCAHLDCDCTLVTPTRPCTNPAHAPDCPAAERLFGADSNATLGMDPVRYLRHQRDECPADEPCALCMYELGERMYHKAIDARDEAHRVLHRVRQLCDDPDIPHAGSCASYRVFKSADGPHPCDCIVASIRRALP